MFLDEQKSLAKRMIDQVGYILPTYTLIKPNGDEEVITTVWKNREEKRQIIMFIKLHAILFNITRAAFMTEGWAISTTKEKQLREGMSKFDSLRDHPDHYECVSVSVQDPDHSMGWMAKIKREGNEEDGKVLGFYNEITSDSVEADISGNNLLIIPPKTFRPSEEQIEKLKKLYDIGKQLLGISITSLSSKMKK